MSYDPNFQKIFFGVENRILWPTVFSLVHANLRCRRVGQWVTWNGQVIFLLADPAGVGRSEIF